MKLICVCSSCKNITGVGKNANDRGEFSRYHGKEIDVTCISCKQKNKVALNQISAVEFKYFGLIFVILFVLTIGLGFTLFYTYNNYKLPFFSVIPLGIFFTFWRQDQIKVKRFNSYRV